MSQGLSVQKALEKYGKVIQPVKGDSMYPMLDDEKDAVELVSVTGCLQKYDLPLYQRPNGKLVLHRIIDVKKNYYLTCGDNRTKVEKVPKDWILAVASGFYKSGTYVSCQDEQYLSYVQEKWKDFPNRTIVKKVPRDWKITMLLYRMAITGREEEIPAVGNMAWETIYKLCKSQKIGAAVYPILGKVDCPEQILEEFKLLGAIQDEYAGALPVDENAYLRMVEDIYRRYTEGGFGMRDLEKMYLLGKQAPEYDMQYIDRKLEEKGLGEFASFWEETTRQFFDGDIDAIANETVHYLFGNGAYDTVEYRVRRGIKNAGKGKYFLRRVFLPYSSMCQCYPCLRKIAVLLPVFWGVRLVKSVCNTDKRRRMRGELTQIAKNKKKNG